MLYECEPRKYRSARNRAVIEALDRHEVRYLLAGHSALNHHADLCRFQDTTFHTYMVDPATDNTDRLNRALEDLSANNWPAIDTVDSMPGVKWANAYPRRSFVREDDLIIPVMNVADLRRYFEEMDWHESMRILDDRCRVHTRSIAQ
jgi:hypothetical protein